MIDRSKLTPSQVLDRVLVLEMVRVTEYAAIAANKLVGRGDERLPMRPPLPPCAMR